MDTLQPPRLRLTRQENMETMQALIPGYGLRYFQHPSATFKSPPKTVTLNRALLDQLLHATSIQCDALNNATSESNPQTRLEFLHYLRLERWQRRKVILERLYKDALLYTRLNWTVPMLEQYVDYDPVYQQLKHQIQWFEQLVRLEDNPSESFVSLLASIESAADLSIGDQPTRVMKQLEWHMEQIIVDNALPVSFYECPNPILLWTNFLQRHFTNAAPRALDWFVEHFVYARKNMRLFEDQTLEQYALWFQRLKHPECCSAEQDYQDTNWNQMAETFEQMSNMFPSIIHQQWEEAINALSSEMGIDQRNRTEICRMLMAIAKHGQFNFQIQYRLLRNNNGSTTVSCLRALLTVMAHLKVDVQQIV